MAEKHRSSKPSPSRSYHRSPSFSQHRSSKRQRYSPSSSHRDNSPTHYRNSSQRKNSTSLHRTSSHYSSTHCYSSPSQHPVFGHGSRFYLPSSNYRLVFVNNETSLQVMNQIMDHVAQCRLYAIDTESEMSNNELALVQVQSMPHQLPSYIIFIELHHLPSPKSEMYVYVKKLFDLIFRSTNKLYGWGNIYMELNSIQNLITRTEPAELINIQPHYAIWYERARILCRVQSLMNQPEEDNDVKNDRQVAAQPACSCHPVSPYKPSELWSLQKALFYASGLVIEKECTRSHWAQSLTSTSSSLSYYTQQKMIDYAKEDVMSVIFLLRPIMEQWTFTMIKDRRIDEVFMAFQPTKLPTLPKPHKKKNKNKNIDLGKFSRLLYGRDPGLSDEEIYLCQLIEAKDSNDNDVTANDGGVVPAVIEKSTEELTEALQHDLIDSSDDELLCGNDELNAAIQEQQFDQVENESTDVDLILNVKPDTPIEQAPQQQIQHKSVRLGRARRSSAWKKHNNKKRNNTKKKNRYRYFIKFDYYNRFPKKLIRKILRYYNIEFTHVKEDDDKRLLIGLKNSECEQDARRKLSSSMFNRNGYFHYRRKFGH
ncbi:unnamed protein product [Rotaria sp. Silwood1]|nr:unnamed protein product [Rotaria sp. Silwood1]CAF5003076.1 unnamed protein product [Rotaria sp. Silwood1]